MNSPELSIRFVSLHDGRPGLRETMSVEIREPSDPQPSTLNSQPVLDFVSSDATLDRYHEIIVPAGWRLDTYARNPVFQNAHQYGDIIFTLGRAITTEIRSAPSSLSSLPSPCLFQRIEFATNVNPMARIAYGLYVGKFLNAVSVGFVPLRWVDGNGKEYSAKSSSSSQSETLNIERGTLNSTPAPYRRKYLEQELLEVSAVGIPANPNALALAFKSGAVDKSDLRDTLDLLRLTLDSPAPSNPRSGRELIRLADSLYQTLRKI